MEEEERTSDGRAERRCGVPPIETPRTSHIWD